MEIHGTVYYESQRPPEVPAFVKNHGLLPQPEFQQLLRKAKVSPPFPSPARPCVPSTCGQAQLALLVVCVCVLSGKGNLCAASHWDMSRGSPGWTQNRVSSTPGSQPVGTPNTVRCQVNVWRRESRSSEVS